MADKYGIPAGGDPYPGKVNYLNGNQRKLTVKEVYAVCRETWPKGKWELAAAIALAESGGSPFIYNTYKQGHFGLFQISRSAWPEFFAGGSDQWADPRANAKQAYAIYQKQGYKAWQGFTDGGWEKHRNAVAHEALRWDGKPFKGLLDDIASDGLGTVVGNAADAVGDAASTVGEKAAGGLEVLGDAWETLTTPAFWMRVAYGVTGIALVIGGLALIVRTRPGVQAAVSTVASAVPGGAAVKGAVKR